jgi:hypothetical protein
MKLRRDRILIWGGATLLAVVSTACEDKSSGTLPVTGNVPVRPTPAVGQAMVSGTIVGDDGRPVGGATVKIAENDEMATSDAAGVYQILVPSDSTITMVAAAPGFTSTFRESILVAANATVTGFDFLLVSPATLMTYNTMGAPGQESTRGVMAVRLHSMDPACQPAGATVTVWPPLAAKVIYSQPAAAAGGIDRPDPTLTSVAAGANVQFWLAGVMPPGNLLRIQVQQPGCQLGASSPSLDGLLYPGERHVVAGALTEADLFLGRTP